MAGAVAIVVAGGVGRRMGAAAGVSPKQYLELEGEAILLRAVRPFLEHPAIHTVIVVIPEADLPSPPRWLRELPVHLVAGGAERSDSVWNGLMEVPAGTGLVLIHDGARPFVSGPVIDRVLECSDSEGVVPGVPVTDTIKAVDEHGYVRGTPDRARLWHAQTPQAFPVQGLRDAFERARREGWSVTDDASLWERCGRPVRVVLGDPDNLKITRPADLETGELLARAIRRRTASTASAIATFGKTAEEPDDA